jgi:uncharacterized protein (TIGR02996 family)
VVSDGEALRRVILAEPDEDTPRLVYADWLQENGQTERAEFIRAQIEAVRADPFGPKARAATRQATAILEAYRSDWTRHLHGGFAEAPRFERGFVAHLSVEPKEFVPRADALLDAEPIQALKLYRFASTGPPVRFEPFFELPRLKQLRRFELSSLLFTDRDGEEYALLSGCPHLANLRDLSLRDNPVPPTWLSNVLRGDLFPELMGLDLADGTHLGPSLAESLPRAGHRQLKRLDLSAVRFTSDQLYQILTSRCLREVEELLLATPGGPGWEGPLFRLGVGFVLPWTRLVVLDVSGQWIGNDGVRDIAVHKEAAALRWLGLANNGLSRDAVRYLVDSKHLALNYLDVRRNNLSLGDIDALHRRFPDARILSDVEAARY